MKTLILSLFLLGSLMSALAQSSDEAAIKDLLEKQTKAGLAGNVEFMIETWANVAYATRLVSLPTGRVVYYTNEKLNQSEQIRKTLSTKPAETSSFTHSNYQIRVNGPSAFVTFNSTVSKTEGGKGYGHEVRYLEKINGEWKVVHATHVFYQPSTPQTGR